MPYQGGNRLPAERAGKLGHLDVLKSPLVNELCRRFESSEFAFPTRIPSFIPLPNDGTILRLIFGVDGSLQVITGETPPQKALAFVKTALLRLDLAALESIDKDNPHPYLLRDLLEEAALYHATVFPLRYVSVPEMNIYHTIRHVIFESMNDASLGGEPLKTLKWLAYEKWSDEEKSLPRFECPHCRQTVATLPYDVDSGSCPNCSGELLVTDMLGFHLEMADDSAPDSIASDYMSIHETLMLFTGVRHYWESNRIMLKRCLFIKDGPLSIRAQYSKLVNPIRNFLAMARWRDYEICIIGQEKTGAFADHLALLTKQMPAGTFFVPGHQYIREEIQHRPIEGASYGKDTNYGAKVFYKLDERHAMVLNIPTGPYVRDPHPEDLIGYRNIFASLPDLFSSRFENGLLPVELAHSVASLATYPSAQILKLFAEQHFDH